MTGTHGRRVRAIATALAVVLLCAGAAGQQIPVLHIKVTVVDADGQVRPVPRHALLISDNPATAAPQRKVTTVEGTADIRLPPGNYTVESDEPLIFQGNGYEWRQTIDVLAGHDMTLELTAANATVEPAAAGATGSGDVPPVVPNASSPSALLSTWQDSVVSIWSPTRQGAGFLVDARGLIVTSQRVIGRATTVEVQLSRTQKVAARVLASNASSDIAILWIDPGVVASVRPVTLAYAQNGQAAVSEKDKVFAVSTRIDEPKGLASGIVSRVNTHTIVTDLRLDVENVGAPVFAVTGDVVAMTTMSDESSEAFEVSSKAVRVDELRPVIADAEKALAHTTPPAATPLPVEPLKEFDDDALKSALGSRRAGLSAYQVTASDFEVSLITPVLLYGVRHQEDRTEGRPSREPRNAAEAPRSARALQDFGTWSGYVGYNSPVVMIRVTPKLVEGFWTTVARGAAQTQGVSVPPIKHLKATLSKLRLFCGDTEVIPIHALRIDQRDGEGHVVSEGLYVFDPSAIAPACGTVKLQLFSEKEPDKPDARVVDPAIVQQVWGDFASYRAAAAKRP